ncbi:MAG: CsgG/HfaB family protein [Alphaproteobacteria bacterium]
MKKFKFIFAIVFSLALMNNAFAKEIEVEALGVGDDYDWAVLNAVENAVRQTSDIEVGKSIPQMKVSANYNGNLTETGNSVLSKDKNVNVKEEFNAQFKTIEAYYHGKVKSYKVQSMEEKEGKTYVKILATVEKIEDYKSPELVKKAEYKMAVMPFKGLRSYNCSGTPIPLSKMNESLNNSLTTKLSQTQKFSIVDRQNLDDYAKEANLINDGYTRDSDKNKLKNIAAADYMIVGSISEFHSTNSSKKIEVTGEEYSKSSMKLVVNYSIIEVATTEVIFSDTAQGSIRKDKKLGSCISVLNNITDKIGDRIVNDSLTAIFPDYKPVKKVKSEEKKATKSQAPKERPTVKLPFDN